MRLIVITGLLHPPKVALTQALIQRLSTRTDRIVLIDNGDEPLMLNEVSRQRLTGGCVCCSLAAPLIPLVWRLQADEALLVVSGMADPEVLSFLLSSLRGARVQITTIALIDSLTQTRHPYLAQKLAFYSDQAVYDPFDFAEVLDALV